MKNSMFIGLAIGLVAGAVIANKNKNVRRLVNDAQEQIVCKIGKMQQAAAESEQAQPQAE